jgi:hypothetical protein
MNSSRAPAFGSRWGTTLDIATLAFVARVALVVYALAEPVWDGHYYDLGARHIAWSHGYGEELHLSSPDGLERVVWDPWAHYPVGYSGFLALFFKIFGSSIAVAPLANALTGAALAVVCHRLALRMFPVESTERAADARDKRAVRANVAGLLVALHPGLVLYSGALMTEPLAALGMMAAILFVIADRSFWRGAAIAGVLLGVTTLVRPNAILLAPILPLLRIDRARPLFARIGRVVASGAVVGALAIATVAPWTIRNCKVMDQCAVVSTNAGWNLVIGSAPGATGKFEFLVGHTPEGGPTCEEGGQVAQDRCWWRYGLSIVRRDLGRWLSLVPAKLHYTLDAEWFPINYLREARPDLVSAATHVAVGKFLTASQWALCIVAALAALGRPRARRDRFLPYAIQLGFLAGTLALGAWALDRAEPRVWPLGVLACVVPFLPLPGRPKREPAEFGVAFVVLTTLITHAVFFGEDRYHLVATPALLLLACGLARPMRPASSS